MHFPSKDFLDFLKDVDACVLENTNVKALQRYGSKLVEVITHQLRANQTLEEKFNTLVSEKLADIKENVYFFQAEQASVFTELTRKLCNIHVLKSF